MIFIKLHHYILFFICNTWEQRKLIDVCDYVDYRGKTPTKTDSGVFLVTAKNVKDGYIDYGVSQEYISEDDYEEVMHRGKPEIGDVLITTEAPCGNVAQVNRADIALAQRIIKYRGQSNIVDNTYLKDYLQSPEFQNILNAKSSGGTVKGIKGSILHQQEIKYPKYEEQFKIGSYFNNLDNLITLHQRKYSIIYNKLITWEQRKLGEIGSVSMCRRIFKEQTSENGEIPFYKIGTFGGEADAFISRELFEEYKAKYQYPKKGDILISASGSIGRTVVFTGKNEYFQDSNIVWLNHDKHLDNSFLKCFYSIVKWAGIEGSTIKRLYNDNILNTAITLPSVEEQQKIGAYFENLDNLITLHRRAL